MIVQFKEDKISDIAFAQMCAWQEAFKGILSESLLSGLRVENFIDNWKNILTQEERRNYIWLNEYNRGVGFISFGKPKNKNEIADFEIYGIYVHPDYWGKRIGYELMKFAIDSLVESNRLVNIILWTMNKNKLSKKFYCRFGFNENGNRRMSKRNDETFEEVQFEITKENTV